MLACNLVSPTSRTFGWGHLLQKGDLSIFLYDGDNPGYPSYIQYSLLRDRGDGTRETVGAPLRNPVRGCPGEYYPVGSLNGPGQPGTWWIVWSFQKDGTSPLQSAELSFMVLDRPAQCSTIYQKYGWD